MAGIQTNRTADGLVELPAQLSADIWKDTYGQSIVQQLARNTVIPAGGLAVQELTSLPEAGWVNETDEKPVSDASFATRKIQPYKMALIMLFSDEFKRDYTGLYNQIASDMPGALARLFDQTALGFAPAPGEHFHSLADAPEITLDGTMKPFFDARKSVAAAGGSVSSWVVDEEASINFEQINDGNDRPLLMNSVVDGQFVNTIAGKPVVVSNQITDGTVAGFAGDWQSAIWGNVEGIKIKQTDQATVNKGGQQINLWQRNMFAVLAEVEVAFAVRDPQRFVKLIGDSAPVEPAA